MKEDLRKQGPVERSLNKDRKYLLMRLELVLMEIADNEPNEYFPLIFVPEGGVWDILFGDFISEIK